MANGETNVFDFSFGMYAHGTNFECQFELFASMEELRVELQGEVAIVWLALVTWNTQNE